ncbi:MAG: hypothetical protein ACXVPU_00535 [Bacteroidia bacterium]
MKKIVLLLAVGFFAITANAQKVMESAVSPGIKASFVKLYPGVTVTSWTKEPINNIRAEFVKDGVRTSVLMGPNNNLLETSVEIKATELPQAAADFCKGKTVTKTYKTTSYRGVVSYKVEAGSEYIFDKDGNMAK